jgi:hypothetical protein
MGRGKEKVNSERESERESLLLFLLRYLLRVRKFEVRFAVALKRIQMQNDVLESFSGGARERT